jgi:PD-(D/E)XK nuclease superfamily protein
VTVEVVARPPTIPSKWDVIPIHSSDVASFKRCRRYWDWTSPTRNNLRRRVEIYGLDMNLWFGTGMHYALEMFYDPILRRDPTESFKTWYGLQVDGGVVGEEWLERTHDPDPRLVQTAEDTAELTGVLQEGWRIRGLRELLPNWEVESEAFETHLDLGIGMCEYYKGYAERYDDFVVVAAESTYSIPLGFESIDVREESPNYGKSCEVHARGKRDAIVYWPSLDRFGIFDHKTAAKIDEQYHRKLEKDEQCSNYLWATMQEAKLYDLPWNGKLVDRIVYNALRKNYPKPPTITTQGWPSLDRQKEGTTAEYFQKLVVGNEKYEAWFRTNDKAQAYYAYLCENAEDMFIVRTPVTRNAHEINATGRHLRMIAEEMLSPSMNVYPNPTGEFRCIQCAFRAPCIAADDGSDWQGMLADGYEQNRGR